MYCARVRRRTAPAAALATMSATAASCWTPKSTDSAAAPAAAASVNSQVGAGGDPISRGARGSAVLHYLTAAPDLSPSLVAP